MRDHVAVPAAMDVSSDGFDRAIEWLLAALLAFMPLALGVVQAWSEQVVIGLATAISICFCMKLVVRKDAQLVWSWAYVPVALFIVVAVLQLVALPASLVNVISPNTAALKKELLGDLPNADAVLANMTLSFYPHAGKHDLRLVLAIGAVFLVVLNVYRTPEQIKRLLGAIAIIGGAVALLALIQDVFGNGKIYWFVPTGGGRAYSGPFVNHSHFGQFMNLSIGAALGLIMVKLHEAFAGKKVTPPVVAEYLSSPGAKVIWLLVGTIILGAAAVFVSLTRGGMVSMLIAAAFTTVVLSSRESLQGRSWIMVLMALGAFICVLYIGFDAVYDRLATLRDLHEYHGRWQIVKDIGVAWTKFPVVGTGLGTHEVVYPMFDRSTTPALAAYAENEYAQAAEETGLLGLAALAGLCVAVWVSYVRNVTTGSVPIRSAAYGLGFGLVAVMIHSLSDFGQHLPANSMLTAVSCALLLGLAQRRKAGHPTGKITNVSGMRKPLCLTVLLGTCAVWAWAMFGANRARIAEGHWKRALGVEQDLMSNGWQGTDEQYTELISQAAAAAACQPENIHYRHWLNVYRWRCLARTTDPNTGNMIVTDQIRNLTEQIVDELQQARPLCPCFGATYCVVGELERSVLDMSVGAKHIKQGYRLAPCNPTACFVAGSVEAENGEVQAAFAKLSRAAELNSRLFPEVAAILLNDLGRPDLAIQLAGDNTYRLRQVANLLVELEEHKQLADQARQRIVELLKARCEQDDAPARVLASVARLYESQHKLQEAIMYYRRALALDYGQVRWRFALARLLAEAERVPDAIHEARICLRLQPQFKSAERLIADLSVHPALHTAEGSQ